MVASVKGATPKRGGDAEMGRLNVQFARMHRLWALAGSESCQNPTDGLLSLVLQIIILKMSCTQCMLIESELDEDYIKELAQLALDVMKRNNNKPIRLLMPICRKETIMELKGTDSLEQWDKDLCEYGWLTGRKEWSAETNEIFDECSLEKMFSTFFYNLFSSLISSLQIFQQKNRTTS